MMKKMGRPSRKAIATSLKFEDPNGEIFLFEIDKKGNAKMIIDKNNYQTLFQTQNLIPNSLFNEQIDHPMLFNDQSTKDEIQITQNVKTTRKEEKSEPKDDLNQLEKFNLFLGEIEKHMNMDTFYRDFRLSEKMLFPINA